MIPSLLSRPAPSVLRRSIIFSLSSFLELLFAFQSVSRGVYVVLADLPTSISTPSWLLQVQYLHCELNYRPRFLALLASLALLHQ